MEYYQVMLIDKADSKEKVKDLTQEELIEKIVEPYEQGEIIFVNGASVNSLDITRIHIRKTTEKYQEISNRLYQREKQSRDRSAANGVRIIAKFNNEENAFWQSEDVLDEFIKGPPGYKVNKQVKLPPALSAVMKASNKIFLVHGHNEEMKQSVARLLEKLGFDALILHEQPNKGRTIIEKFSDYSDLNYAIVLLSADDKARSRDSDTDKERFRARQNVILELGYFLGKLGRDKVLALYEEGKDIEIPSDFSGVLYVGYAANDSWKLSIAKELRASGFELDMNKLIS